MFIFFQVPHCFEIVINSIFPMFILKFLVILAVVTILYLALAYLLEWCIKHWFPHAEGRVRQRFYSPLVIH